MKYLMPFLLVLSVLVISDDVLASRFSSIAGGVSGDDYEKTKQLKFLTLGAGLAFLPLSLLLFLKRKKLMIPLGASVVVGLIGAGLIVLRYTM